MGPEGFAWARTTLRPLSLQNACWFAFVQSRAHAQLLRPQVGWNLLHQLAILVRPVHCALQRLFVDSLFVEPCLQEDQALDGACTDTNHWQQPSLAIAWHCTGSECI